MAFYLIEGFRVRLLLSAVESALIARTRVCRFFFSCFFDCLVAAGCRRGLPRALPVFCILEALSSSTSAGKSSGWDSAEFSSETARSSLLDCLGLLSRNFCDPAVPVLTLRLRSTALGFFMLLKSAGFRIPTLLALELSSALRPTELLRVLESMVGLLSAESEGDCSLCEWGFRFMLLSTSCLQASRETSRFFFSRSLTSLALAAVFALSLRSAACPALASFEFYIRKGLSRRINPYISAPSIWPHARRKMSSLEAGLHPGRRVVRLNRFFSRLQVPVCSPPGLRGSGAVAAPAACLLRSAIPREAHTIRLIALLSRL